MNKRHAWKVGSKLLDRFLDALADNGYMWFGCCKANEYKPFNDGGDSLLIIEWPPKTITHKQYSSHLYFPIEEYDITEVTEGLLRYMENISISSTIGGDDMETQNEYMVRPSDYMEKLINNVEQWAQEKEIADYENWEKQFMKFQEEAFELYKEMVLHDERLKDKYVHTKLDMKLEMGDVLVTLIVLAEQQDIELSECLSMAWNKIKHRRGKTIDGQFYKQEDL